MILGIDPGPTESAYCQTGGYEIIASDKLANDVLLDTIEWHNVSHVAIESIQSYGMAVGRSVFETCYMVGRIIQKCIDQEIPYSLYPRQEYAKSICGTSKISDAILRQALLLRFGGDKKGEPLYLLKGASDKRSAYAVAVYHMDRQ